MLQLSVSMCAGAYGGGRPAHGRDHAVDDVADQHDASVGVRTTSGGLDVVVERHARMHEIQNIGSACGLASHQDCHLMYNRWILHAKSDTVGLQIPEGTVEGMPAANTASPTSPTKPARAEGSIRISANASRPLAPADKDIKSPVTASDTTKPRAPIQPRSAASFAGAATARNVEPTVLIMPRDEAWPRLLAYEVTDR